MASLAPTPGLSLYHVAEEVKNLVMSVSFHIISTYMEVQVRKKTQMFYHLGFSDSGMTVTSRVSLLSISVFFYD
jgi:hypothetical protein